MRRCGGMVPMRFDAPVIATSRVAGVIAAATLSRSTSPVAGSRSIQRIVAPTASAACTQGRTLPSWSSRETTTSSPLAQVFAIAREMSYVS